jgi:hypothetical protein
MKTKYQKKNFSFITEENNSITVLRPIVGNFQQSNKYIVITEIPNGEASMEGLTFKEIGERFNLNKNELKEMV